MRTSSLLVIGAVAVASAHPGVNPLTEYVNAHKANAAIGAPKPAWTKEHEAALAALLHQGATALAPHMTQMSAALKSSIPGGTTWAVLKNKVHGYLAGPSNRRHLQIEQILAGAGQVVSGGNWQLSELVDAIKAPVCQAGTLDALLPTLEQGIQAFQLPPGLPSIPNLIRAWHSCFCNGLTIPADVDRLFAHVYTGIVTDGGLWDTDSELGTTIEYAKKGVVAIFGEQVLCAGSCQKAGVALIDFVLDGFGWVQSNAQTLAALAGTTLTADDLAAINGIPAPSLLQRGPGIGQLSADCVCSGFQWGAFIDVITSNSLIQLITSGVGFVAGDEEQQYAVVEYLNSNAFRDALAAIATIPQFLISDQGACATSCAAAGALGAGYADAFFNYAIDAAPEDPRTPPAFLDTLKSVSAATAQACICGGTIELATTFNAYADVIADAVVLNVSDSLATVGLVGSALSATFSPSLLCSSTQCAAFSGQVLDLVGAASALDPNLGFLKEVSEIEWCPAPSTGSAARSAGKKIKQAFTLQGAVSDFDAEKQTKFKEALANKINEASGPYVKLSPGQIDLVITAGSVNVEANIAVSSPTLVTAATTQLTALSSASPADVASTFASVGVTVDAIEPPAEEEVEQEVVASPEERVASAGGGDDNTTIIIIAAAAGAVVLLLLVIICMMKKSRDQGAASAKA